MTKNPVLVYGAEWCADCHEIKQLFAAKGVAYDYKDIDDDPAAKTAMLALTDGKNRIPTIVINDTILQEPSTSELLAALNLKEESVDNSAHDVIIVGAGPAALAAAIYTTREDIDTVLFERGVVGGLAAVTDKIDNYPGFPEGIEGLKLADDLRQQAERFGAVIELGEVTAIHDEGDHRRLETTNGDMTAKAVLIATGSDYKKLGIPGEQEFYARGVHYCATCDGAFYRDKRIVVVGGGNSAIQETIFLTRFASHIDLLVRSTIKASDILQEELKAFVDSGKVTVHLGTQTKAIVGKDGFATKVVGSRDGKDVDFETDGVFVFVGLIPNSQFVKDSLELDQVGFIKTDDSLRTTVDGIFAAGDIRSGATMQIASAVGEGATAALKIREFLEGREHPAQN